MLLAHRDVTTGEIDQEVELEWDGPTGWTIMLRVRELEVSLTPREVDHVEASAALSVSECRALAAVLLQMADRFEKER